MGAHVFVVNKFTYPVHRDRGFCGVVEPPSPSAKFGLLADLKTIREGDRIFLYLSRTDEASKDRGFLGIYQAVSEPFSDDRKINGVGEFSDLVVIGKEADRTPNLPDDQKQRILPYRILIKAQTYFENPVNDNRAYVDKSDKDELWTMIFRKVSKLGGARSISHLLPEEEKKLIRLVYKANLSPSKLPPNSPYPAGRTAPIKLDFETKPNGELTFENMLVAWLVENIDKNDPLIRSIIGPPEDIEFFGNHVQYGIGGETLDILCLHKKTLEDGTSFRYKVSVIEAKKGTIDEAAIFQSQRYSNWMSQLVKDSDLTMIQPIVVGFRVSADVIETAKKSAYGRQPIILTYKVVGDKIQLKREL